MKSRTSEFIAAQRKELVNKLAQLLSRRAMSHEDLARRLDIAPEALAKLLAAAVRDHHIRISEVGGLLHVPPSDAAPAFTKADLPVYRSRKGGVYKFGVTSDNHLGSKYARLDVLNELYDIFAEEKVDRVFNAGNWIDGDRKLNKHDLLIHGMDGQLAYLAEQYPARPGLHTYAVAGDDHEGWFAQEFGVDIGRRAEQTMREAGRKDWHDLGYMEAHIELVHRDTGAKAVLANVHPGGGSAYALSYSIQKIIEALDGGEKPQVGLYGHYHKLWAGNIRNVWCAQTGCTEDQTPFMRKKKLAAHVGGLIIELRQDAESGAITRCKVEMLRWFNRGFRNGRWNMAHGVDGADRVLGVDD